MIGKTLAHYEITSQLGRGGMGEVFLADDLSLDRRVALKFLPDIFTGDPERMARFEREAKLLASLNHPNIAAIYGIEQAEGKRFLVLEYVEGETLQARLNKGALPLEDTLEICRQIAEGLETAHEKGVIHRDLKPANVMITAEEKVKILDFGLAKALSDETQSIDSSQSPTLTEAMTRPGVILGTAAYMSPEQAKGKTVDKRADIWAFGCILYECLTGKKAFEGETATETLAAVIKEEPDWDVLPNTITANLQFALHRCLDKAKDRRFRDAADIRILIEEKSDYKNAGSTGPVKQSRFTWGLASIASFLFLAVLVMSFLYFNKHEPANAIQDHKSVNPMPYNSGMAISPDGGKIAFVAISSESTVSLYVMDINSIEPAKLERTEGASYPFWSPDSRSIGFYSEGFLKTIDISGGPSREICAAPLSPVPVSNTWNDEGTILFGMLNGGLRRVSALGGDPVAVTELDLSKQEVAHTFPSFLPDGNHYLYTKVSGNPAKNNGVFIGSLDSEEPVKILDVTSKAIYAEPGYILFQRKGSLYALPFDKKRNTVTGKEVSLPINNIAFDAWGWGAFSASQKNGILVYRTDLAQGKSQLIRHDRSSRQQQPVKEPDIYETVIDLFHDSKLAVIKNNEVQQLELDGGIWTPITSDSVPKMNLSWSPDGSKIAYSSARGGMWDIYSKTVGGLEEETPFRNSDKSEFIKDWSGDGKFIIFTTVFSGNAKLYSLSLSGDEEATPFVASMSSYQDYPQFSFDGKWVAFQSNDSGTDQIYVAPFPAGQPYKRISIDGGTFPTWRADGKELYYLSPDGMMMTADIDLRGEIKASNQRMLFDPGFSISGQYDVTSDGQQFFLFKRLYEQNPNLITVTRNWTSLLKQ